MRVLADRLEIAAVLVAAQALGACVGDADDPRWGVDRERLGEDAWIIGGVGDFNADGAKDLLWSHTGKSKMAIWLMAATHVLLPGAPVPGPSGDAWRAVWATDFNADKMDDVRWLNAKSRETSIFLMAGTDFLVPGPIFPGPPGDGWERVTSLDVNADDMADLAWHNALTDAVEVWLMNGTEVLLQGPEFYSPLGHDWIAPGVGDFNADGIDDFLWTNATTGSISIGLMNGTASLLQGPVIPGPPGDGWGALLATGFNADGMDDVLWYNPITRMMEVWLMSGTELLLPGPEIPAPPGDGWALVAAGDVNADGQADVIWDNTKIHRFAVWLMNGTEVLLCGAEIPRPTAP
jgi:hypothetical protein